MKETGTAVVSPVPFPLGALLVFKLYELEVRRGRNVSLLGLFFQKINTSLPLHSSVTEFFSKHKKGALETRFKKGVKKVIQDERADISKSDGLVSFLDVVQESSSATIVRNELQDGVYDQLLQYLKMTREEMGFFLSPRCCYSPSGRSATHGAIAHRWQEAKSKGSEGVGKDDPLIFNGLSGNSFG